MNQAEPSLLSVDEFIGMIGFELDKPPTELSYQDRFDEDLGVDSLGMLNLVSAVDACLGGNAYLTMDLLKNISTIGDAYRAYLAAAQMPHV